MTMSEDPSLLYDPIATLRSGLLRQEAEDRSTALPEDFWSLLMGAGAPNEDEPSSLAEALTRQSQSFIGTHPDGLKASDDPEASDEFAARLTAAFQSGALDHRAIGTLTTFRQTPRAADGLGHAEQAPKTFPRRLHSALEQDGKRQKYMPNGTIGRSLYTPW